MRRKTSVLVASLVLALVATYQIGRTEARNPLIVQQLSPGSHQPVPGWRRTDGVGAPDAALSPHPSEFRESGPIARVV